MTLTMAMSIVHRITGVGLYIGVLLMAWFLLALSGDATTFATSDAAPWRASRHCAGANPGVAAGA